MLRKQEVDGSYLSIKWAGAASSSQHSSHWSFPARTIIISSGYDHYYRYYLSLQEHLLFPLVMIPIIDIIFCCYLIITYSWLLPVITNSIFPCNNNYHLLVIITIISMLSFLGKIINILSWFLSVYQRHLSLERWSSFSPDYYQHYQSHLSLKKKIGISSWFLSVLSI